MPRRPVLSSIGLYLPTVMPENFTHLKLDYDIEISGDSVAISNQ
jgi:hypothetical protein